jgi:hypothetical protein
VGGLGARHRGDAARFPARRCNRRGPPQVPIALAHSPAMTGGLNERDPHARVVDCAARRPGDRRRRNRLRAIRRRSPGRRQARIGGAVIVADAGAGGCRVRRHASAGAIGFAVRGHACAGAGADAGGGALTDRARASAGTGADVFRSPVSSRPSRRPGRIAGGQRTRRLPRAAGRGDPARLQAARRGAAGRPSAASAAWAA